MSVKNQEGFLGSHYSVIGQWLDSCVNDDRLTILEEKLIRKNGLHRSIPILRLLQEYRGAKQEEHIEVMRVELAAYNIKMDVKVLKDHLDPDYLGEDYYSEVNVTDKDGKKVRDEDGNFRTEMEHQLYDWWRETRSIFHYLFRGWTQQKTLYQLWQICKIGKIQMKKDGHEEISTSYISKGVRSVSNIIQKKYKATIKMTTPDKVRVHVTDNYLAHSAFCNLPAVKDALFLHFVGEKDLYQWMRAVHEKDRLEAKASS